MKQRAGRIFFSGCNCCEPNTSFAGVDVSRRNFLAGGFAAGGAAAAVGAGLAVPTPNVAQAQTKPRRVDVHHHIIPPPQVEALIRNRGGTPAKWSASMS